MRFLLSRYDHPTADTVYLHVKEEFPNISLGTVYRNLALLTDLGELFEDYAAPRVDAGHGEARAELDGITAQADAAGLTVHGDGPEVLRWRTACAAWWAVHPRAEEPTEPELRWR